MKYERMTDPFVTNEILLQMEEKYLTLDDKRYIRLSELEDKIEGGTLLELPFAIGTIVYVIYNNWETDELDIRITDIVGYEIMQDELWVKTSIPYRKSYIEVDRVFLTKDEAEKRLKELRGEV